MEPEQEDYMMQHGDDVGRGVCFDTSYETTPKSTKYALSDDAIDAINRARSAVAEAFSAYAESVDDGKLLALARVYQDSAFRLLNWSQSHGGMELTYEQLHNRPAPLDES